MKTMLKRELADAAGVSMRTLHRWCQPYRQELIKMGVKPNDKLLSPKVARFLADKLCIDLP
jgi:hypothetical protein